ncbi:unnamed protein product [Nesidiocoris tenuis]|uniref:Reverse transcriptase (RNA-dependent DNA polymerase) n=2 Tax=Nesidiocoris tenuis TaxID=355587 RepID=A0ABN7A7R5_9HEMI|nr:Reverse transcriptase (RNA-dependent DNA polymerase) [Nesidiocoris tenuis]CAB0013023.1 unnamed protein product [Nesidiocoris tenuis]
MEPVGTDSGSDGPGRRLSDPRVPSGSQGSPFTGKALMRSPDRPVKRPRSGPADAEIDDAVGNALQAESKSLTYRLSVFLNEQSKSMSPEHMEYIKTWNHRSADLLASVWKYVRQLEGKCLGMVQINRAAIAEAVREGISGARLQQCSCQSLSPIVRQVDGIREDFRSRFETSDQQGPQLKEAVEAMKTFDERIGKQGRFLEDQVRSCTQILKGWSDIPSAGTDTDEGGWIKKTRRKKTIVRPRQEDMGGGSDDKAKQGAAGRRLTYSQALGDPLPVVRAQIQARLAQEGGPTPAVRTGAVILSAEEGSAVSKLASLGSPAELGLGVKGARPGRNGDVIVELEERASVDDLLRHEAVRQAGLVARAAPTKRPRLVVHGVPSGLTQAEFESECIASNLPGLTAEEKKHGLLPLYKVGPRSLATVKWIVEVSPKVRMLILKEGRLKVGWFSCRAADDVSVTRCWKCHGFGHVAKLCLGETYCGYCAEKGHTYRDCKKEGPPKCFNCAQAKLNANHDAAHPACPSLIRAVELQVKRTDYGTAQ